MILHSWYLCLVHPFPLHVSGTQETLLNNNKDDDRFTAPVITVQYMSLRLSSRLEA